MLRVARISAEDARYVLYRLVADGVISVDDVEALRKERRHEVDSLKAIVAQFVDHAPERGRHRTRKKETRPRRLSAEVRERRRLQGRFVGLLRTVPEERREEFRRLYKTASLESAIAALEEYRREPNRKRAALHRRRTRGATDE